MKKTEFEKREYITPEIEVFPMSGDCQLQSTSIQLDAPHSTEEEWGADEELDGGDTEI